MPNLDDKKAGRVWAACIDCGKERWVDAKDGQPESLRCRRCASTRNSPFQKGCRGSQSVSWKGGRNIMSNGYIKAWIDPDDPLYVMIGKCGYALEHRLVMARHLKRCLEPWEIVHHKNSIRDDNRIENLELLPNRQYHQTITALQGYIKALEAKIVELATELEAYKDGV